MDLPAKPHRTIPSRERSTGSLRLSLRELRLHQSCDDFSGRLIYLMVVFSPWAFGTTESWSIWIMNALGYLLGIFLGIKLAIRKLTGYQPARWGENNFNGRNDDARMTQLLVRTLALTTVLLLAYCLIGVVNARSTYHREV